MLCQQCQRVEATIQIIKSIDGVSSEYFYCAQCARSNDELDFTLEPAFSLHQLFSSMLNQNMLGNRELAKSSKLQCSSCGLTFAQFSQVGRFGCSNCYTAFTEKLKPLIKRIHASSSHPGKVPQRVVGRFKAKQKIDRLREELKVKISKEQFEEAAVLRDEIKEIEKKVDQGTTSS